MRKEISLLCLILSLIFFNAPNLYAQANPNSYLKDIKKEFKKKWPHNRTVNLVFHGHSVPTGYGRAGVVKPFDSYPFLLLKDLSSRYPYAVINIIRTSKGGENSVQGEKRFKRDVLPNKPDVVFIDYALNDRKIGLKKAKKADEKMIKMALRRHIKVILMTPSPDLHVDIKKSDNILEQFTDMIMGLAQKYNTGLVNSYAAFKKLAEEGHDLKPYMAQANHPNMKGHQVITHEIIKWFE